MGRVHAHGHVCDAHTRTVECFGESKVDGSPTTRDDGRSIETVLYAVSINPLLPVPSLFSRSRLRCPPLSIRQVLLTRLVFTGKTDIYRFILARKAHGVAFNVLSRGPPGRAGRQKEGEGERETSSTNIPSTCRDAGTANLLSKSWPLSVV